MFATAPPSVQSPLTFNYQGTEEMSVDTQGKFDRSAPDGNGGLAMYTGIKADTNELGCATWLRNTGS